MFCQLEITTRCNYACWYCAGRDMPQKDMQWDVFCAIVDGIQQPQSTVSLQGEGEPTLHPQFWEMVAHVKSRGHVPYTIINGSRVDALRIAQHFPSIGVSIDTLDPEQAEKIGRYNVAKVLSNLAELRESMHPKRIVIMTVDMGQPLESLRSWVKENGFGRHIVQPLMRKQDYAKRYATAAANLPLHTVSDEFTFASAAKTCQYLHQDQLRYYTWNGLALPCCFIKDTTGIDSIRGLQNALQRGDVPKGCAGCKELKAVG